MTAGSPARIPRLAGHTLPRRVTPRWWVVIAAAVYLGTAIYLTWPMPRHIRTVLYGQGGDAFGTVGLQELANHAGLIPFLPGQIPTIGAPGGRPWDYALSIATFVVTLQRWVLSLLLGDIAAWNVWVLLGYLGSGLSMFLLVRRLTRSPPAALIAGWAFAFFPFSDIRGGAHVDFIHTWPLVLLAWRALELRLSPTRRNGWLVCAALSLCILLNPYFWLFAAVVVGTLLAIDMVGAIRTKRAREHVRAWAWAILPQGVLLAFLELITLTYHAGAAVPSNGISDAILYSARPLDYLVPVPGSGLVPSSAFAGDYASGIATGERGLYVGWSVLALALLGAFVTWRGRGLERSARADVGALALVGFVGLAFSAIPIHTLDGHALHLPSYYIVQLSGAWRVFARFVIVVMMALCVLAGVAIARLIRGRPAWLAVPILVAISCLLVKDLFWKATPATISLPINPIWQLLGTKHDNALAAEYPLVIDVYSDYRYMLSEPVIRHRLLNGYLSGTPAETRAMWLEPLSAPDTASDLARLDVRWVLVNESDNPPQNSIPDGAPGRGFHFVARAAGWSLWRVTARPASGQAYPTTGFSYPFGTPTALGSWLTTSHGTLRIEESGCAHGCDGTLRFSTSSFAVPHRATFSLGGRVLASVEVTPKNQTISVPMHLSGPVNDVSVSVTPPGVTPQSVNGSPDRRNLSIDILEPTFVRRPGS